MFVRTETMELLSALGLLTDPIKTQQAVINLLLALDRSQFSIKIGSTEVQLADHSVEYKIAAIEAMNNKHAEILLKSGVKRAALKGKNFLELRKMFKN
jgi:hypothetical protein